MDKVQLFDFNKRANSGAFFLFVLRNTNFFLKFLLHSCNSICNLVKYLSNKYEKTNFNYNSN